MTFLPPMLGLLTGNWAPKPFLIWSLESDLLFCQEKLPLKIGDLYTPLLLARTLIGTSSGGGILRSNSCRWCGSHSLTNCAM